MFGASVNSRQIIEILREHNIEPVNVIDNDKTKVHSYCARLKVISPDEISNIGDEKNIYLLYSAFWREMRQQMQNYGVNKDNVVVLSDKHKFLLQHFAKAMRGKKIYDNLMKKFGDVRVFLCPYTGTGDIYLIGTFWSQYLLHTGVDKYVFVVISGACKRVAELFGIKNIEQLKGKYDCAYLIDYYLLCPDKLDIKILNDSWGQIHTNPIQWFRGYKGLNFTEMFRRFVFDLKEGSKPNPPLLKDVKKELECLFQENHLQSGKTVVLSPYSNTLADLPDEFWKELADELMKNGYSVTTNSSGGKEPAIAGTVPVFFPLNIAPQFVSRAGYFIGVRSGFCDIISCSEAEKIILYDSDDRFYNSSAYDYFSLNRMGFCEDAVEIEFKKDIHGLVSEIVKIIDNGEG